MSPSDSNLYPPLFLTLRFASHLPDLPLPPISNPAQTTALSLLPQIRQQLPATHSTLRILLISSGRILPLREPLSRSLNLPSAKKLGKAPAAEGTGGGSTTTPLQRTIHATFTLPESPLSSESLAAEAEEGLALAASLLSSSPDDAERTPSRDPYTSPQDPAQQQGQRILQGFDRLSAPSIGIPAEDIANLRTHFRALVAAQRGDEQGPLTPMEMLVLEEAWLDDDHGPSSFSGTSGGSGDVGSAGGGDGEGSHVDDVLWGNVLGFFWPLGALFWFVRLEGAWRERRRMSVFVGVLVNLGFCLIRAALVGGGSAAAATATG